MPPRIGRGEKFLRFDFAEVRLNRRLDLRLESLFRRAILIFLEVEKKPRLGGEWKETRV